VLLDFERLLLDFERLLLEFVYLNKEKDYSTMHKFLLTNFEVYHLNILDM